MSQAPLLPTLPASRFLERVQSIIFGEAIGKTEVLYHRACTAIMATTAFEYIWAIPFFFLGKQFGVPADPDMMIFVKMVYYTGLAVGIIAALTFEYVTYKAVWGDRDVFEGEVITIFGVKTCVPRWRWKFLVFAPNYVAVASSSYAAGLVYWAHNESAYGTPWMWRLLAVLLIVSACVHCCLVGYWTSQVKALPHPSAEKEAVHGFMAEACDAGNMQFMGVCYRAEASDSEQRSRLAATVLVKMPLLFAKAIAIVDIPCFNTYFLGRYGALDAENLRKYAVRTSTAHMLSLALLLNMYGIMQLLPTFLGMLYRKPLRYCVPLLLILSGLLGASGCFPSMVDHLIHPAGCTDNSLPS